MCTYETENISLRASGKTAEGWRAMNSATVYFDHPVHFAAGHALMIDIRNKDASASERVALELDPRSARELAETILRTLESVPSDLLGESVV
ncbi:MAG TPA: DUF6295 family protein [Acidimicrobiales bacterium]